MALLLHLSILDFDMIKKSLLTASVLIIAYWLYVTFVPVNTRGQSFYQANSIRTEQFIFQEQICRKVIVGTSLSLMIFQDSLPSDFYNLSLAGMSTFDGLRMLQLSQKLPDYIFVEINGLLKKENPHYFQKTLTTPSYEIHKYFSFTREENFPAIVTTSSLRKNWYPYLKNYHVPEGIFLEFIQGSKIMIASITEQQLNESVNILKSYTDYFESKGVKIIFFEMPINHSLLEEPNTFIFRKVLYKNFPHDRYSYITYNKKVKTMDGLHLTEKEGMEYSSFFRKEVERQLELAIE